MFVSDFLILLPTKLLWLSNVLCVYVCVFRVQVGRTLCAVVVLYLILVFYVIFGLCFFVCFWVLTKVWNMVLTATSLMNAHVCISACLQLSIEEFMYVCMYESVCIQNYKSKSLTCWVYAKVFVLSTFRHTQNVFVFVLLLLLVFCCFEMYCFECCLWPVCSRF